MRHVSIRRVVHGTYYTQKIPNPHHYPTSPAIKHLLSQPTWSVRSLLPPSKSNPFSSSESDNENVHQDGDTVKIQAKATPPLDQPQAPEEITREKLHHLLNLSALPHPKTPEQESKMLQTLRDQVHFVKAIQSVDTTGVEPLITIRDESEQAIAEETITLAKMMPYLELEEKVGKNGTVRRRDVVRTPEEDAEERKTWAIDVADLGVGSDRRRKGKFFYVRRNKEGKAEKQEVGSAEKMAVSSESGT